MREGFSPPGHIHTREDELFLVLDGEVAFDVDGRLLLAGPGTSVYMPRGMPHTFRIESPVARMLGVIAPGGPATGGSSRGWERFRSTSRR
jgi:mannose-6-phosphate isomerase-like protein (cupin superfamily)